MKWPSRDPIEEVGGTNLYCFGPNSPVNGVDVLGKYWISFEDWLASVGEATEGVVGDIVDKSKDNVKKRIKGVVGGKVRVKCCNPCPDLLRNWRYISEDGPPVLTAFRNPDPDGVYSVDAVYRPGVAHKLEDNTSKYIICQCDKRQIGTNINATGRVLWGAYSGAVYEWKAGDPAPPAGVAWPGGDRAPKPYHGSP